MRDCIRTLGEASSPVAIAACRNSPKHVEVAFQEGGNLLWNLTEPCRIRDQHERLVHLWLLINRHCTHVQLIYESLYIACLGIIDDQHISLAPLLNFKQLKSASDKRRRQLRVFLL
ncbi:hypothetical protein D3C86_1803340 [compost metagenome]